MKVLFGLNNDDTVKSIVKYYEETYKEKVEYKNVYYFKQAVQELTGGNYDRVVLLENLEKYPTNNQAQIDDFIFHNIDAMTDEFDAKKIVFIASDRRELGDEFLAKLFNIGVYTVLTGRDRTKSKTAQAINTPKMKKDVKQYYENSASKNVYSKIEVSEMEIQRIISYYQNQKGDTSKYVEIFDKIGAQYTNEQLRIIVGFLPASVKDFLKENSDRYNQVLINVEVSPTPTTPVNNTVEGVKEVVHIEKQPEIIEKIVVKQQNTQAAVVTKVVEKEVVRNVYEVPKDYKKVVCVVGAPKVGTTFCINAISNALYRKDVKVGIVDLTKKRDTYTLYTYDNEGKRAIAAESMKYASNGLNEPLMYGKLSIYTGMPGEDRRQYDAAKMLETVSNNNSIVLLDCDFSTPVDYYRLAQEIYIVQDMDVLNVSLLTIFLREIKARGIPMNKVRVIINKHVKCALTAMDILNGIAVYSSPDLKMFDDLFVSSEMTYYTIPFDQENYVKYVEMMYKYTNTFKSFTDEFKESIDYIANAIYPLGVTKSSGGNSIVNKYKKNGGLNLFKKPKITEVKTTSSGFEKVVE
ncbi:MAG: hypothetical protein IKL08_01560 [Clostridia bacterium]|nr:hypothetical protein [Clostridia bacterium]